MRSLRPTLALGLLLLACTPPPKVAGYSQDPAAPPPPDLDKLAAPPLPATPSTDPSSASAPSQEMPTAPATTAPSPTLATLASELGVPGGFAVEAMSPRGSYVAYCQPVGTSKEKPLDQNLDERGNGDRPVTLTLAVGARRFDLEEVLATDPQGRFVATLESGAPWLHDTKTQARYPLAPLAIDLERDALPDHRSLAFSEDGRELALVVRSSPEEAQLHILDLNAADPTQTGRKLPLSARPWRIFAEGENFVVATSSANGTGPGWPVRRWSDPNLRCVRGTFDAFARISGPLRDPALSHAIVRPADATPQPAPGFVMTFGSAWVRREDDGRLLIVQGKQQRQLASARCGGRILGADLESGWFLVSCEEYRPVRREDPKGQSSKKRAPAPKVRFPLYLLKPGVVRDLDVELMRFGVDVPLQANRRFVAVRALGGLLLVDFRRGRASLLEPSDRVLFSSASEVVLASDGRLVRWEDGKRTQLGTIGPLEPTVLGDSALAVGRATYSCCSHLAAGQHAGGQWETDLLARAPLGLGAGFALVPTASAAATRWARGPVTMVKVGSQPNTATTSEEPAAVAGR